MVLVTRSRILFVAALAAAFLLLLGLAGCSSNKAAETTSTGTTQTGTTGQAQSAQEESAATSEEGALYTPSYQPTGKETAVFKTTQGDITVELYGKDAPIHVGNFVELVRKGFYNGTKFHRYEPGFVIQGGDPQTQKLSADEVKQAAQTGNPPLGTGGPGYVIKGEFDPSKNPRKHEEGALGMARGGSPDSAGSQFYFALQPLPQLDGNYTVFGKITKGLDVMKKLRIGDEIKSVEIQNAQ